MNRLKRPNSRRRALFSLSVTLVAGVPLLAACGSAPHPGAAAVVGGQRIPVSALQGQVDEVRTAQQASPQAAELISNSAQLSQAKLNGMIFDRILDRAAHDAGVSASRHEVQTARRQAAASGGGERQFEATLLQQGALTPGQIDDAVRRDVLMSKLAKAVGGDTTTPAGQQKVLAALARTSKDMRVDVNPRYGSWDNAKVALASTKTDWIKQVSGQEQQREPSDV